MKKGKKIGKLKIKGHNKSKMGKKKSNRKDSRKNTGLQKLIDIRSSRSGKYSKYYK
jgi:hypothetical protein